MERQETQKMPKILHQAIESFRRYPNTQTATCLVRGTENTIKLKKHFAQEITSFPIFQLTHCIASLSQHITSVM